MQGIWPLETPSLPRNQLIHCAKGQTLPSNTESNTSPISEVWLRTVDWKKRSKDSSHGKLSNLQRNPRNQQKTAWESLVGKALGTIGVLIEEWISHLPNSQVTSSSCCGLPLPRSLSLPPHPLNQSLDSFLHPPTPNPAHQPGTMPTTARYFPPGPWSLIGGSFHGLPPAGWSIWRPRTLSPWVTFSKEWSANLRVEPVGYLQSHVVHLSVATVSLGHFQGEQTGISRIVCSQWKWHPTSIRRMLDKFNTHLVLRMY